MAMIFPLIGKVTYTFTPSFGGMYNERAYILGRAETGLCWVPTASGSIICPDLN
jgi:hypothetical protein